MARLSLGKGLAVAATALVLAAVAVSFLVIEGPGTMRELRFDARRLEDLNGIVGAVNCYWTLEGRRELPADLEALRSSTEAAVRQSAQPAFCGPPAITDPETGEPYGYRMLGGARYELCTTFLQESDSDDPAIARPYRGGPRSWRHDAGEHCFTLTAEEIKLPGIAPQEGAEPTPAPRIPPER